MDLQFYIENREYTTWYAIEQNSLERKDININPFEEKIFTGDVCCYEDDKVKRSFLYSFNILYAWRINVGK